jgi:hypothetical protein
MNRIRKQVATLAVTAILDTQLLLGLKDESPSTGMSSLWSIISGSAASNHPEPSHKHAKSEGMFSSLLAGTGPNYAKTVDGLKEYLSDTFSTLNQYFVVLEHRSRILSEMIRVVAVTSFNGLMSRRNFTNFNRGNFMVALKLISWHGY